MKLVILVLAFSLVSCETIQEFVDSISKPVDSSSGTSISSVPKFKGDPDASNWNIDLLDTARAVTYLTEMEKDVILEMNKVRTDPKKYSLLYLKPMLRYFKGNQYSVPNEITMITTEGAKAVEECIRVLNSASTGGLLYPEKGLSLGALDHVNDQSKSGRLGHDGSDGSNPSSRVHRYGVGNYIGENISYGYIVGRNIVSTLLIDDGVPSRGHRTNILNKDYNQAGISIGNHKQYRYMCVLDYSKDYVSK